MSSTKRLGNDEVDPPSDGGKGDPAAHTVLTYAVPHSGPMEHLSALRPALGAGLLITASLLAGCGSSSQPRAASPPAAPGATPVNGGTPAPPEANLAGDIPDTVAYVPWTSADGKVSFVHPEGWAQTAVAGGVMFTDKLNSVTVVAAPGPPPTIAQVQAQVNPTLGGPGRATTIVGTEMAPLPAGPAVRVTWQVNSLADPVTAKVHRDEVVTYLVGAGGQVVRMDLSGAVGSDNVDPYRKMSQSLAVR